MASVGVQMMMVRDKVATDGMQAVLERIAGLGYNSVEVSQVPVDEANVAASLLEHVVDPRELDLGSQKLGAHQHPLLDERSGLIHVALDRAA